MSSNGETLLDAVRALAADRFGRNTTTVHIADAVGFATSLLGQAAAHTSARLDGRERVVDVAAAAELDRARRKHPRPYSSGHEGWAVILEEIEESGDELVELQHAAEDLWSAVRGDNPIGQHAAVDEVERRAVLAAAELVQVVATCKRFREDLAPPAGSVDELEGRRPA